MTQHLHRATTARTVPSSALSLAARRRRTVPSSAPSLTARCRRLAVAYADIVSAAFTTIVLCGVLATSADTDIWELPAPFGGFLVTRTTLGLLRHLLPDRHHTLLFVSRWLHAYLLAFGWLVTAHTAAPEAAPLIATQFLYGAQLGRMSGRLPSLVVQTTLGLLRHLPDRHHALLFVSRWLHAYLLAFGWLATAHTAAPEAVPLIATKFLHGAQLGRMSGRLPGLRLVPTILNWAATTVSATHPSYLAWHRDWVTVPWIVTATAALTIRQFTTVAWLELAAHWLMWVVVSAILGTTVAWLGLAARWLMWVVISVVSTPVRERDRRQRVILAPRVLRPWVNITAVILSVACSPDPYAGTMWVALVALAVIPAYQAWQRHLAQRATEQLIPTALSERLGHALRRHVRLRRGRRSRPPWTTALLPCVLLLGATTPTAGLSTTSFRHTLAGVDGTQDLDVLAAPLLWPLASVAGVAIQKFYSTAVATTEKATTRRIFETALSVPKYPDLVDLYDPKARGRCTSSSVAAEKSLGRLLTKEAQHKRNPYAASRSALFDDPTLGAGGPVFAPEYSRDIIPGRIYGNHAEVSPEGVERLRQRLDACHEVFHFPNAPLPTYRGSPLTFEIPFEDELTPQYQGPRIFSAKEDELIASECKKMKEADVLEDAPIDCPHASNPVLAAKKDPVTGEYTDIRFCVDYRAVNKRTRRFNHRTLTPEQLFDRIGQSRFLTTLDLKSGYHLIPLAEHVRNKTAFWCGTQLVRFKRMPFGLAGSPAFFQLVMDRTLGDLVNSKGKRITAVYLDDIIIMSETYEEHLEHIELVLRRLIECFGPHCVHPDKSIFVSSRVEYLGYILEAGGRLGPHPAKIKAFSDLPSPASLTALRSALSLFSYYRAFIGNFSQLAAPLHELLRADAIPPGANGFKRAWTTAHEEAFRQLRAALCRPGLAIRNADHDRPFYLHCDWSVHGCGAILTQFDDDNKEYIVACRSRSLNDAERRYSPYEGEAMTVVWATAVFRPYVYGQRLTVITDHKPLQYLLNNAELSSKFARWVAILQDLDITVVHRPGTEQPADHLSRYPLPNSTDATGARSDTDAADIDPMGPVIPAADEAQLNALAVKLHDSHTIYGVSSCFALATQTAPAQYDQGAHDDLAVRYGMTELELRQHRLVPLLPPPSPTPPLARTAQWLNDVPRPLPLQHRAWVVIELCGGIAAGLHSMIDQGQTVSRYIYVDNCDDARRCAAERARKLVEARPQLFRRHAIKHAFDTWPQDLLQLLPEHLDRLQLQPDESVMVIAGTPCQDWSTAGSQRGETGARGSITPIVADIIANLQQRVPTFYLLENVPPHLKGDPTGVELYERLRAILGTPVVSDAARFDSFAHRVRLYWTNLAPTSWLQTTLDRVHRSPRRYLHHILPTHLKPLKPTGHRGPPYYPCGDTDQPRQTLPTIMATVGSYAYRDKGPGMLFDLNTMSYVEPPPRVREIAMGHPPDVTAHPGISDRTRVRLIGNSFDMAAINHIMTAALLLNGRLHAIEASSTAAHPSPLPRHHMLGAQTHSQLTQRYGPFASRELMLWGYRPGMTLGLGGGPCLPWPLSHTPTALDDTAPVPRPGIGFSPTAQNCGGGDTSKGTIFVPAVDTADTTDQECSSPATPATHACTTAAATAHHPSAPPPAPQPLACRADSAEPPLPLPDASVREPRPVQEMVRSSTDPLEDDAMLKYLRGEPITTTADDPLEQRRVILRSSAYTLTGGTLHRRMTDGSLRRVPPIAERAELIRQLHDASMHLGEKRMVHLLQQHYCWPKMWRQVHEVLLCCDRCRRVETTLQGASETLHPLPVPLLFSRWHVDYMKLPTSKAGFCRVLVTVEALTKFAILIPTTNKSSALTAFLFRTHVFGVFGSAAVVVTDQGREFQAEFDELLQDLLIDHRVTSTYHAQANGAAERIVQVIKHTMRKLTTDRQAQDSWERAIPSLALAYNATRQSSTGLAPFTCVFAQVPAVPPEAKEQFEDSLALDAEPANIHDELLATHLLRRMRVVSQCGMMCAMNLSIAQQRDERRYRLRHSGRWQPRQPTLEVGDFAVLRGQATSAWDVPRRREIYQITGFRDNDSVELRGGDDQRTTTNRSNLAKYPAGNVDRTIFPIRNPACAVCKAKTAQKTMLICDGCHQGYHAHCLEPPLEAPPEGDWFCPPCCGQPAPARKAPRGRGRPPKRARPTPPEPTAGPHQSSTPPTLAIIGPGTALPPPPQAAPSLLAAPPPPPAPPAAPEATATAP